MLQLIQFDSICESEDCMKTITLRHLSPPLSRLLQRRALKERSKEPNKTAIRVMEESLGLAAIPKQKRHHDLDRFAGLWSEKEAHEFDRLVKARNGK